MRGTLLFVHGTGVRDVRTSIGLIRKGVQEHVGIAPDHVHAVEWGRAVGPQDLDIRAALPPDVVTRALTTAPSDAEVETALWDLLSVDPLLELRVLAETAPAPEADGAGSYFGEVADVEARRRLQQLAPDPAAVATAGVTEAQAKDAATSVADSPELADAASGSGAWNAPELVDALARAVTATVMFRTLEAAAAPGGGPPPVLLFDAAARDRLVGAVATAYAPEGTRGVIRDAVRKVVTPLAQQLATRAAVKRRARFMDPLTDFLRDVAWYVARGHLAREFIADAVRARQADGPVVLLGHSLGGIAAVDLLSDPALQVGDDRLDVDLLVTVGSQAPLLYLIDALATLRPGRADTPFVPWLNVYNRQDLLSFYASGVFVNAPRRSSAPGIVDVALDAGVPFPQSHSAYWDVPQLYHVLAEHWPAR